MQPNHTEDVHYPSIVFKLQESYYAINCKQISSIMHLPKYQSIPTAPPGIIGLILHRGNPVPVLDLRLLLSLPSRKEEHGQFANMITARKSDHINWVKALRHSVVAEEPFHLATDPHQCAFGKWYDNFTTTNQALSFEMRKIEEPHRLLHESALYIEQCKKDPNCNFNELAEAHLQQAEQQYVKAILRQLDDIVQLFSDAAGNSIALVLDADTTQGIALVVDEVCSVSQLEILPDNNHLEQFQRSSYLTGVALHEELGMILVLDEEKIMNFAQQADTSQEQTN